MKKIALALLIFLSACVPRSAGLLESVAYCDLGRCSRAPVMAAVTGKNPSVIAESPSSLARGEGASIRRGFTFSGWIKYDGRADTYGPKYLALLDGEGRAVCRGQYLWIGFGRAADVNLICFNPRKSVSGSIRTVGRQTKGQFRGKGMGTGLLSFAGGKIALIFGFDPPETGARRFGELWRQYGGRAKDIPAYIPALVKNLPLLRGAGT